MFTGIVEELGTVVEEVIMMVAAATAMGILCHHKAPPASTAPTAAR